MTDHQCPTCGRPTCPHCGGPVTRSTATYCSLQCSNASKRARTLELAEDVEFLIESGSSAEEIARRVGKTADTLARTLQRAGRGDLARFFNRERDRERRHPCADCDVEVSAYAKRCVPCATRHKRGVAA